jgi:hypothetical protein
VGNGLTLCYRDIFGIAAETAAGIAEDPVAGPEVCHSRTHGFNDPGKFCSEHPLPWTKQAEHQPSDQTEAWREVETRARLSPAVTLVAWTRTRS